MNKPPTLLHTLNTTISGMPSFPLPLSDEEIKQKYQVENIYHMHMNESAYGASPSVIKVLQAESNLVGYYPVMRDDPLREKLVETIGRNLSTDHFFTGCSGYETLELLFRALLRPNDEVIVMHPTFGIYDRLTMLNGGTVRNVPLADHTFAPDIDAVLKAVNEKTRIVLVCNPNNPTGTVMPKSQMDKLVHNMPDHVLIVADEVYFHFVTDPDYPDSIQYVLDGYNVAIIHTFSKGYGMAGMRIGYGITLPTLATYVHKFYRGFHLNRLQIAAGITALDDPAQLQKNIDAAVNGRDYIYTQLDKLDLHYWRSQTNFILIKCPCPAADISQKLLERGVIVRTLHGDYANYLRVTVITPEANQAFATGLEIALQELR
ncbi:MAG: histidinol-phosphate transaminase [Anaerolineae bacterium]|nr:histidinol-phosphate transaminase [Anaerolineae bacterium]